MCLRAQVHGEHVVVDQILTHHVVEDGCSAGCSQARVRQAEDTVSAHVLHEGSFSLTQADHLVLHSETTHLRNTTQGLKTLSNYDGII